MTDRTSGSGGTDMYSCPCLRHPRQTTHMITCPCRPEADNLFRAVYEDARASALGYRRSSRQRQRRRPGSPPLSRISPGRPMFRGCASGRSRPARREPNGCRASPLPARHTDGTPVSQQPSATQVVSTRGSCDRRTTPRSEVAPGPSRQPGPDAPGAFPPMAECARTAELDSKSGSVNRTRLRGRSPGSPRGPSLGKRHGRRNEYGLLNPKFVRFCPSLPDPPNHCMHSDVASPA